MKRALLTAALAAAIAGGLAACVTETPYQPAPPGHASGGFGYRDSKIDSAHWRVAFSGNSFTSRETVEKYLLYRAAQLTLEQGSDWFETTDRHTDRNTSYVGTDPYWASYGWGWHPYWGFGGPWGFRRWGPWGAGPSWPNDLDIQQVSRFEASAEIVMGKGPPPTGQRVFDAHEVEKNLGPSVVKPPQS